MKSEVKIVRFIISGQVQKVGFRNATALIARKLSIHGQIRNLEDETVEIIAQGMPAQLEKFKKAIQNYEWPIEVEHIQEQIGLKRKIFQHFKIIRGKHWEELEERLDVAALHLQKLGKEDTLQAMRKEMAKEETLQAMRKEMAKEETLQIIKADVSKENTLEKFNQNTEKEFKDLDRKYGSISQKLDKLDAVAENLGELSKAILVLASKK